MGFLVTLGAWHESESVEFQYWDSGAQMKEKILQDVTTYRWDDLPEEQLNPLISRKLITGERTMLAHIFLKKGSVVPAHSHDNEQMTYIIKGALKFTINGREIFLKTGEVMHIPSNVIHSAVAVEDTLDLDIFCPPRQDWLDKTDAYLRGK
jgi:quercetin dioxygenase-like cupin family protein